MSVSFSTKKDLDYFVQELRKETPTESLEKIGAMKEADLILLHHGYGTWIRNKWLWGSRNKELIAYFQARGIGHPDEMSMKLITGLWKDLQTKPVKLEKPKYCSDSWKLSVLEFSPSDPYLKTVLQFSYGKEASYYITKLSGAISRFYYDKDQSNSKFTFFSTYYADIKYAREAFNHLSSMTKGKELQDVFIKDKQIVWFSGREISKECFYSLKIKEFEKL